MVKLMPQEHRINPYFSEEQVKIIDNLIDKIGCSRADVVKQLVLIKLADMGYFDSGKRSNKK